MMKTRKSNLVNLVNPLKSIKVSKHRKKGWRKHSNVNDVEEFLEDERLAQRIGSDENKQGFYIEKVGVPEDTVSNIKSDDGSSQNFKKRSSKVVPVTKDILSTLTCFKSFEPSSKVEACKTARGGAKHVPKFLRGRNFVKKFTGKREDMAKSAVIKSARVDVIKDPTKKIGKMYDMWDDPTISVKKPDQQDIELQELSAIQLLMMQKNKPKINPLKFKKPSLLQPIEFPHPGMSYNPTFNDHQDLLRQAHLVELKKVKEEEHLNRVLDKFYPTEDPEIHWIGEMSQGLGLADDELDDIPTKDDQTVLIFKNPIRREDKKPKSQKRKELLRKQIKLEREKKKEKNCRDNQIYQLKRLKRVIREAREKSLVKQKKKQEKEEADMYRPKLLGSHKFVPQDMEVNLSGDIKGTLREIKTEGTLLNDRFKSLQRRNMIEPRVPILKQRRKKKHNKMVVKKHCRD